MHGAPAAQHLVWEVPTRVGAVRELGAQTGKQRCCPVLVCPKCLPAPMLESTFLWFRVFQTAYARGKFGLILVLFRLSSRNSFLPLLLSPKALALRGPAKACIQSNSCEDVFSYVSSPPLQASVNGFTIALSCLNGWSGEAVFCSQMPEVEPNVTLPWFSYGGLLLS